MDTYFDRMADYNERMRRFHADRNAGGAAAGSPVDFPEKPTAPSRPESMVQEPSDGIVLNLPPGEYRVRLRARNGAIVEGSEKSVVSFERRRSGNVGYEIVPESRWTMPETSSDPSEVVYFYGENTFYVRPFIQVEFNDLYYAKLLDPQDKGDPESWRWVNITQLKGRALQLKSGGRAVLTIGEKPYIVKQAEGPELGYEIFEYDRTASEGSQPSMVGYRVQVEEERSEYQMELLDDSGEVIPGSRREFRPLHSKNVRALYLVSLLLPAIGGVPIFLWRRKRM
jgi:hypothetical protein